jgi:hypothetical protein
MIDQLMNAVSDLSVNQQSEWLHTWGIDDLVDEGRKYWEENKSAPDVTSLKMRSRQSESLTLLGGTGFGKFCSLEWHSANVLT